MSQITVPGNPASALAGMLADTRPTVKTSRSNAEASASFPFGIMLARFTDTSAKLPAASNFTPAGILILDHAGERFGGLKADGTAFVPDLSASGMGPGAMCSVLQKGAIWVVVDMAVTAGNVCYVRYATGSGTQLGAFASGTDSSSAAKVRGATFRTSTAGAGLALVEFDLDAALAVVGVTGY